VGMWGSGDVGWTDRFPCRGSSVVGVLAHDPTSPRPHAFVVFALGRPDEPTV